MPKHAAVPATKRNTAGLRPEIQALRAIAVGSVVVFHLWPGRMPGGYVGVDIFFAISGFLIIGHLLREVDRTGRVRVIDFWAKRVRRLFPASLLVIVATAVVTVIAVPDVVWRQWFQEMGASAVYAQNWLLALNSVDYLGADNRPSPTQHFWSLSVEEQFYIAFPLVIIVVLFVTRRARRSTRRRAIGVILGVLTAASFAYSVWAVATDPAPAYFVTQSRAWEFGLGGMLAYFAGSTSHSHERLKTVVSWAGIVVLGVTVFTFTGATPFPGAAALIPVAGTLMVIWAGVPRLAFAPSALFRLRPVQWVGDISYSLYLWHWAPIVILPFVLHGELGTPVRLGILVGAVALAWLTKRFVEDPARLRGFLVKAPPWRSIVAGLTVTAVIAGGCVVGYAQADTRIELAASRADAAIVGDSPCLGAYAIIDGSGCASPYAPGTLTDPAFAKTDIGKGVTEDDKCKQGLAKAELIVCRVGDVVDPVYTVGVIGDSHAAHFVEALDIYGAKHHIRFETFLKTFCAGLGTDDVQAPGVTAAQDASCGRWGRAAIRHVAKDPQIDGVIFANYTRAYAIATPGRVGREMTASDVEHAWKPIVDADKTIIAIKDIPYAAGVNVPDCVSQHLGQDDPCTTPRRAAVLPDAEDPMVVAAKAVPEVHLVDVTDVFCQAATCHSVIGGLVVYFDDHHMTASFSRTMATIVGSKVSAALE